MQRLHHLSSLDKASPNFYGHFLTNLDSIPLVDFTFYIHVQNVFIIIFSHSRF